MLSVKFAEVVNLPELEDADRATTVFLDRRSFTFWNDTVWRSPQIQVNTDDWLIENVDRFPYAAVVRIWSNKPCLVVSRRDSRSPWFPASVQTLEKAGFAIPIPSEMLAVKARIISCVFILKFLRK